MPMFEGSDEDRTETATAHRREEFRKQGSVAMSKELLSVAILFAVVSTFYFASHTVFQEFTNLTQTFFKFGNGADFGKSDLMVLRMAITKSFFWMVTPMFVVAMVAGIAASAAQVGFYVSWEPLTPKFERLDPVAGLGRLVSAKGLAEAVKALFKIAVVGWVIWSFLKGQAPQVGLLMEKAPSEQLVLILTTLGKLFFTLLFSTSVIAGVDYFFQRFQLEKQMKMTRREMKEEFKMREGDPLIKNRIKSIQRRIAGRRMMDNVPKAAVVVTNPTHLAIALQYEEGMAAPRVLAKGAGLIAQKIREIAKQNGIPIVENKPLARAMFKTLQIGHYIPRDLYKAVAEVLAYVFKLKGLRAQQA